MIHCPLQAAVSKGIDNIISCALHTIVAIMGIKFTIITDYFRQVTGKVGFIYQFPLKFQISVLSKSKTRYRMMYYLNRNAKT